MTNGFCKLMRLLYELSNLRSFQAANDVVRSEGVLVNLRVWTTQRQTERNEIVGEQHLLAL